MPVELRSPRFWPLITPLVDTVQHDATLGVHYIVLDHSTRMRVLNRTAEELFSATVARAGSGMKVVVNGNYYDVSRLGLVDALVGHDPVAASHTTARSTKYWSRYSHMARRPTPVIRSCVMCC